MTDVRGKNVCFVGLGGIGVESCKNLLLKGIEKLAVLDLVENTETISAFQTEYPEKDIFFLQLDVTNKAQIEERIKEVVERLGHIDIFVNGAGIINEDNPDLTVAINLTGLINSTLAVIPHMDTTKGGRGGLIVNISSVAGLDPIAPIAVYSATKFGIVGFTRAIADQHYYETTGIACIAICPGLTITNMVTGVKKGGTFEHSAHLVMRDFVKIEKQTAQQMGESFIKCLEVAENGSLWICDRGEIEEAFPNKMWKPKPIQK